MLKSQNEDFNSISHESNNKDIEEIPGLPSIYESTIIIAENSNKTSSERTSDDILTSNHEEFHKKRGRKPLGTGLTGRKDVVLKRVLRMIRKFFNE